MEYTTSHQITVTQYNYEPDVFVFLRVHGEHLLDSLEDGTEFATPLEREESSTPSTGSEQQDTISDIE